MAVVAELVQPPTIPRTTTLGNFWQGVIAGHFIPTTQEQIEGLVDEKLFGEEPLIPLTKEEEQMLQAHLRLRCLRTLNDEVLQGLSGNPVVFLGANTDPSLYKAIGFRDHYRRPVFLIGDCAEMAVNLGQSPLTVSQKTTLYRDPELFNEALIFYHSGDGYNAWPVRSQASRSFFSDDHVAFYDSYGFSQLVFRQIAQGTQDRTGKEDLSFCDVGGNIGLACAEVQRVYPDFIYTNITIDEEPAMWDGINHVIVPAERMPKRFSESFDLVVSNMAWLYFIYPDIALRNVLASLSVGGYAEISFSTGVCPLDGEERETRLRNLYDYIKKLREIGMISFNHHRGHLCITKKASFAA